MNLLCCRQKSGGITFGGSYSGFGGSLDLDISKLNFNSRNSSNFGSKVTSFRIGTSRTPYPISFELVDISDTLLPVYWTQNGNYRDLNIAGKRANLIRALEDYADFEGVADLTGT